MLDSIKEFKKWQSLQPDRRKLTPDTGKVLANAKRIRI